VRNVLSIIIYFVPQYSADQFLKSTLLSPDNHHCCSDVRWKAARHPIVFYTKSYNVTKMATL